jgi:hypothetical protein
VTVRIIVGDARAEPLRTDPGKYRKTKRDYMRKRRLIERMRRRCKVFLIPGIRYEGCWFYPEGKS